MLLRLTSPLLPTVPTPGVEGSASSAPNSLPDLGLLDRRLEGPSLTVSQHAMGRRGLYAYSRAPRVESQAFSFNSSGMLNQTGQVGRHTIPPSLTLPSRSSVQVHVLSCVPLLRLPRIMVVPYRL